MNSKHRQTAMQQSQAKKLEKMEKGADRAIEETVITTKKMTQLSLLIALRASVHSLVAERANLA